MSRGDDHQLRHLRRGDHLPVWHYSSTSSSSRSAGCSPISPRSCAQHLASCITSCTLLHTSVPRVPILRARHHLPARRMRRTMPIEAAPFGAAVVAFFLTRFAPEPSVPDAAVLAVREGGARSRRARGAVRRWPAGIGMTRRPKRAQRVQHCRAWLDMRAPVSRRGTQMRLVWHASPAS